MSSPFDDDRDPSAGEPAGHTANRPSGGGENSPTGGGSSPTGAGKSATATESRPDGGDTEKLDYTVIPARRRPQHSQHSRSSHARSSRHSRRRRSNHAWVYGGVGAVLALVLAVVLFAGIGTGGTPASHSRTPSLEVQSTRGDLEPGINPASSLLLSLTVFPHSSRPVAPDFHLNDQTGAPVSMNEFRGKVVMFSVNDDQCQDLCTFLANDIVQANHDLGPAAKDVVWLSVNANPFYPQVSSVKAWTDEHGLGNQPNWHFGTSTPSTLSQVWKKYGIQVVQNKKTRTVVHGTELFVIDPSGHERAAVEFGAESANTALFAHGMAQLANDFLPTSQRVHVKGPETPQPTRHNATVGAAAPNVSLPYLAGGKGTFHLNALRGHYVVLNFWSSTCTACRTELPNIEAVHNFAKSSVDFVGVDVSDRPSAARAMAARAHLTYPLVSDANGSAASAEQITGLPYTIILNAKGTVLIRHPGTVTVEQLKYLLENYAAMPTR